jgi:hypothetical protein
MSSPWLKFYPTDWQSDPALRMCSLAARGLWQEMLCIMHKATPYGSLVVNGKQIPPKQLAVLCGAAVREVEACLSELDAGGVYSKDEDGTIYSRRMRRDFEKAERDRANGKDGGNPNLKQRQGRAVNPTRAKKHEVGLTPPLTTPLTPTEGGGDKAQSQKPEARDSPLPSVAPPERRTRGTRLPEDWQPSETDSAFAEQVLGNGWGHECPKFRDYWHARAGPGGVKIDWSATWRNWCRKAAESGANGKFNGHPPKRTVIDAGRDLIARLNAIDSPAEIGSAAGDPVARLLPPK